MPPALLGMTTVSRLGHGGIAATSSRLTMQCAVIPPLSVCVRVSTADLKHNVTEAMISMARQTGKIGPDVSGVV